MVSVLMWLNLWCGLMFLREEGTFAVAIGLLDPLNDSLAVSEAQRVIDSIPEADRGYFVTYHMTLEADAQGREDVEVVPGHQRIPDEKYNKFLVNPKLQTIPVPPNFARNLLAWAEIETFRKSDGHQTRGILTRPGLSRNYLLICFPTGCVDPNDIGSNCCPF